LDSPFGLVGGGWIADGEVNVIDPLRPAGGNKAFLGGRAQPAQADGEARRPKRALVARGGGTRAEAAALEALLEAEFEPWCGAEIIVDVLDECEEPSLPVTG